MNNLTKRRRLLMLTSTQAEGRLGSEYQEVEWLKGTGTQYCETDIYPVYSSSEYTSIKGDCTLIDAENSGFSIGTSWKPSSTRWNYRFMYAYTTALPDDASYKPTFIYGYGASNTSNATIRGNNFVFPLNVHYEINKENIILNSQTSQKAQLAYYYAATNPILIGANYDGHYEAVADCNNVLVKSFSIYNESNLLSTFVPCYRKSDRKTGFCKIDASTEVVTFFPNLAETEWIIGNKV